MDERSPAFFRHEGVILPRPRLYVPTYVPLDHLDRPGSRKTTIDTEGWTDDQFDAYFDGKR